MSAFPRTVLLWGLQIGMRHRMERQFSPPCQTEELARKASVELVPLHQKTEHRPVRDSQGNHGTVRLGETRVGRDGRRQFLRLEGVANRQGERAPYRFGSVGRASGLPPGQVLLDTLAPGVANRLLGVSARSIDRHAVEQWEYFLIHATAEIRFIITAALDERAQHEAENDAPLGELARPKITMVAAGLGVSIGRDPVAVVAAEYRQVVVPVGAKA